jgi:hypothetical protein
MGYQKVSLIAFENMVGDKVPKHQYLLLQTKNRIVIA